MTIFDHTIAQRLGGSDFGKSTTLYKFELIKRAKAAAKKVHPDIPLIDMGVGEPDQPADPIVVKSLCAEAGQPQNRWYADTGISEFQAAAAAYMERVYGVGGLIADKHIMHGIGSKPILAMLPLCFVNPGDVVLTTVPGYPVIGTHACYLGGDIFNLPLYEENGFLPDLDAIPRDILKRAKMLYLNYPNNPTGAVATGDFFEKVVEFAHRNDIVIVHDAAYAALTYDGYKPLSLLSVDGALEVGVEVHSLSKAFNMTGWRLGFIAGNDRAVQAYTAVKDNTDSGQFRAIQKAGITAMNHLEITAETAAKYSRRFDLLVPALRELGFQANKPKGSFYCYVKAPRGTREGHIFKKAADFAEFLIGRALVSVVPWDEAGHYLRFSVTFEAGDETAEKQVIEELKTRMEKLHLRF